MCKKTGIGVALLLCLLCTYAMTASPVQAATMHKSAVAPFSVVSIDMSVVPSNLSTWECGSTIQVIYNAIFHVNSGPDGGIIEFSYTSDNGRSEVDEELTIIPGQNTSNYTWTWEGPLPDDHVMPGAGGVMVTSPNVITSPMVPPTYTCR